MTRFEAPLDTMKRLNQLAEKAIKDVGPRYCEATHVELQISKYFDGLCRTKQFKELLQKIKGETRRAFKAVDDHSFYTPNHELSETFAKLRASVEIVLKHSEELDFSFDYDAHGVSLNQECKELSEIAEKLERLLYEYKSPDDDKDRKYSGFKSRDEEYRYYFRRFSAKAHEFYLITAGHAFELYKKPTLWISGVAGSGKTHLLCDIVKQRLSDSQPSIFLLGQQIADKEIWWSLGKSIGLPESQRSQDDFISATKHLSDHYKSKVLIVIDAINEGIGLSYWPEKIPVLLEMTLENRHLSLVISCRSSYTNFFKPQNEWIFVEHRGFEQNIFQATKRFFQHYSIVSHEIPLIGEFSNPLFLRTYCESLSGETIKTTSRGHNGIKFIHEEYFKKIDLLIGKKIGYPPSKKPCHQIAKEIALNMAKAGQEWISVKEFETIVDEEKATYGIKGDIGYHMLEEGLFSKDIYYNTKSKAQEEGIRFGFQKFSDIFIAREVMKIEKFSKENIGRNFKKSRLIADIFSRAYQNRNLIEALATLIPEWTKGRHELITLAKGMADDEFLFEAYLDSLIWRNPSAFPDKPDFSKFLRRTLVTKKRYYSFLKAVLALCTTPGHHLSAEFLDSHLRKIRLNNRDSLWLPFLHNNYDEEGVISRVVEWAWNIDLQIVSEESLYLLGLTLVWFCASSNRFIRDHSTKALVLIFITKPAFAVEFIERFQEIDDEYIIERLFVSSYGALARSTNPIDFKSLGTHVYEKIFLAKKVPRNFVIRHYAREIVPLCMLEGCISNVNLDLMKPPFGSNWPKKTVSKKTLEKKFDLQIGFDTGDPRWGASTIFSSVMGFGDFSRYVLGSDHSPRWRLRTYVPLETAISAFKMKLKGKQRREMFDLIVRATRSGLLGFDQASKTRAINIIIANIKKNLIASLDEKNKKELTNLLKRIRKPQNSTEGFVSVETVQNMVLEGVYRLGYDPQLHGMFDRYLERDSGRRADKPERIGKKYQWISYFNVLGLLIDQCVYNRYGQEILEDPLLDDVGYVDQIDPTLTLRSEKDLRKWERDLNLSYPNLKWDEEKSNADWLKQIDDLFSGPDLIEHHDSQDKVWTILNGGYTFRQEDPADADRDDSLRRDQFYLIQSFIFSRKDRPKVIKFLKDSNFIGRWMPESGNRTNPHFAELYQERYRMEDFANGFWENDHRNLPFKVILPNESYLYERGNFDCSISESFTLNAPSYFLAKEMQIGLGHFDGGYVSKKNGDLLAINIADPVTPYGLLFRKDLLISFLRERQLDIFWVVFSEKNLIGHLSERSPGRLEVSTAFILDDTNLQEVGRKVQYIDWSSD
ncbi:hypothetical protein [Oligoflexus tunisiensis]|uniref:hypothetical protein n=1 Tax=Oligoflexus tunisiensis TaxID=708132 RepID=UPI000A6291CA|nr:hypothetical protein [Oligoflexus tunisiensis]